MIAKNEQRKVIVERYAAKRLEPKKTSVDANATPEACEPHVWMEKPPRNASLVRSYSRPRSTAVARTLRVRHLRVRFRDMADRGEPPASPSPAGNSCRQTKACLKRGGGLSRRPLLCRAGVRRASPKSENWHEVAESLGKRGNFLEFRGGTGYSSLNRGGHVTRAVESIRGPGGHNGKNCSEKLGRRGCVRQRRSQTQ